MLDWLLDDEEKSWLDSMTARTSGMKKGCHELPLSIDTSLINEDKHRGSNCGIGVERMSREQEDLSSDPTNLYSTD